MLTLFVLDFCLHVLNGVGSLHFQCDRLSCQGLDKNLHASSQPEYKVKCGFLLDVVVGQGATVFQLFACEDKTLLIWRDSWNSRGKTLLAKAYNALSINFFLKHI
jgi:hypothetical protein